MLFLSTLSRSEPVLTPMTTQNKQSTFAEVDGQISDTCLNVYSTVKEKIMSRTKMTTQTEAMRKFNPTEAKSEGKKIS